MSEVEMRDAELRRLALQIATLLPQDKNESLVVLRYAGRFVRDFLYPDAESAGVVRPVDISRPAVKG